MSDPGFNHLEDSSAISISGKIMFAAVILLFMTVCFVLFLHLYAKWFWDREAMARSRSQRRQLAFAPARDSVLAPRRGLEPSLVQSLPVVIFNPSEFKDGLECAVCLCEVSNGEKARFLPKCNHGFHLDCIDMWFQSHSTCPLCRNPVAPEFSGLNSGEPEIQIPEVNLADGHTTESPNYPTNVLFWGDQNQVSTGRSSGLEEGTSSSSMARSEGNGALVIDIPRQTMESLSLSPSSPSVQFQEEEPKQTRLRSLKRLLSREKRVVPCSPNSGDIEQGVVVGGSIQSMKTPSDS
ncbi:RING-H2 finger protein ATL3-like [Magnolia sinica]|uniref:RING-H2 finger protein ATL3-like n=1 Tax=Magnolia sinica TaxID=86752 RepID=UPI00265B328F|nr:RING-H2 finger protein ATL3-like [Magnolia sinica]